MTYWYCASWSFVGRGTLSCCTFGSHAFDRDDPDYGALDYVSALGYNVMISLIETKSLEGPVAPWFIKLEASRIIMTTIVVQVLHGPTSFTTSHTQVLFVGDF